VLKTQICVTRPQCVKHENCQSHIMKDRARLAESVGETDSPGMWAHPNSLEPVTEG